MERGEVKEEQGTLRGTRRRMRMDLQERIESRRKSLWSGEGKRREKKGVRVNSRKR